VKPVIAPRTFSVPCRPSPARPRPGNDLKTVLRASLSASRRLGLIRTFWSKTGGRGTDVDDLVRVQPAHFADVVGSRIAVRGPKLRLSATAAQAVGLAVHELATNAQIRRALNGCWPRRRELAARREDLTTCWTERNGPPVSPPRLQRHGRRVNGEARYYAPSGLEWHLTSRRRMQVRQIRSDARGLCRSRASNSADRQPRARPTRQSRHAHAAIPVHQRWGSGVIRSTQLQPNFTEACPATGTGNRAPSSSGSNTCRSAWGDGVSAKDST
jgi:hypothetical protein